MRKFFTDSEPSQDADSFYATFVTQSQNLTNYTNIPTKTSINQTQLYRANQAQTDHYHQTNCLPPNQTSLNTQNI